MFAPVPHDRRYSAQWWQAKEEEAWMLRDREQRNREVVGPETAPAYRARGGGLGRAPTLECRGGRCRRTEWRL